jgi:hypothetical protein
MDVFSSGDAPGAVLSVNAPLYGHGGLANTVAVKCREFKLNEALGAAVV